MPANNLAETDVQLYIFMDLQYEPSMKILPNALSWIDAQLTSFSNRLSLPSLQAVAVLLPPLLALILPSLVFGVSLFRFVPNSSDEIIYWREIKTFAEYGFEGGQYSTDEKPALFEYSPFGSHGPAFTILYGLLGKAFGWQSASAVVVHVLLLPLTTILAIRLAQPNRKQLLVLTLLLATWWPLQLYVPSNMQEVLHMLIALVLAALSYKLLQDEKKPGLVYVIVGLLVLGLLFRLTWSFLFLPVILWAHKKGTWKPWLVGIAGSALAAIGGVLFLRYFYSPYPWFSNQWLEVLASSPRTAAYQLATHFFESFKALIWPEQNIVIVNATRYLMLLLVIATLIWMIRSLRKSEQDANEALFHLINLGSVLLFVLLFYDVLDTRDYRMYIAPLLLSSVLFVLTKRWHFAYGLVLFNLVLTFPFVNYYSQYRQPNFNYDSAVLQEVSETINPVLIFDANANRWCKTISVSKYGRFNPLSYPLTAIPSGFGITTILDWKEFRDRPLQARYIWLDPEYSVPGFGYPVNQFDLIELASTSLGAIYENPAANCAD